MKQLPNKIGTYGFDPGLRHAVLLYTLFDFENKRVEAEIAHQWTKKDPHLSISSTPLEISAFTQGIIKKVTEPAMAVGIEWDMNSVYMRTQKVQVVVTSFMIGYLSRGIQAKGFPMIFMTPAQLKGYFSIPPRDDKKTYMARPLYDFQSWELPKLIYKDPDCYDAFLISYFTLKAAHEPTFAKTSLLSQ